MNRHHIIRRTPSMLLVFIAIIVHPVLTRALDEQAQFREYVSQGNYFTCSVPKNWNEYQPGFGLSQEERKVYGVTLFGPPEGSPVPPTISLHYYAPGNLVHKTMARFMQTHSQPVLGSPSEGDSYGEVRPAAIAGRQAKTFERTHVRYIGRRSLKPDKVILFESFAVIPDDKDTGFYVLELSAPAQAQSKYTGIFEVIVKSFQPAR